MNLKTMTMVLAVGLAAVAGAMTQTELQAAVDAASPGDTVYLTSDLEYSSALNINKKLTLASEEGKTYTIRRSAAYASGTFLNFPADSAADLTLTNITVDGNKSSNHATAQFVYMNGGNLTLAAGATLKDYYSNINGTITLLGSANMTMEDGAVISGFENPSYGVAVRVSNGSGVFTMNGGLITGCAGHFNSATTGYDGTVYIYGGKFVANGGTITGNTSERCVAGVLHYSGSFEFGGSFTATNNVGGSANDVYIRSSCVAKIVSDYTGWMTFKVEGNEPHVGWQASGSLVTSVDKTPRAGTLNITSEVDPTLGVDFSSPYQDKYGIWRSLQARIEGRSNETTFENALSKYQAGDTITLLSDVTFTGAKTITKDLTLRGLTPETAVRRGANHITLFTLDNADLRLENVVLDGQRTTYAGTTSDPTPLLYVGAGSTATLGAGGVLKSSVTWIRAAAVQIVGAGSKLIMEDGSLITDCISYPGSTSVYGSVIIVGNGSAYDPKPTFEMRGGLITGNNSNGTLLPSGGYSGLIYNYGGLIDLTGGSITGNVSTVGNSAIVNYRGTLRISGTARVDDNDCPYPGVYNGGGTVTFYSDFRGNVGISSGNQGLGETASVTAESTDATGAWGFYPASVEASRGYVGKQDGTTVKWASPVGSVAGVKAASADDLSLLLPTELDLVDASDDRARLPIVLTGAATSLGGTVALSYDPNVLRKSGDLPLALFAPGEGETLTGEWTYSYPAYRKGCWEVLAGDNGTQSLSYQPDGLIMSIY